MRAGQPFAMRYPLVEVEGSYGTLLAPGSWSAPRYTSARLSALSNYLFEDIQKNTIEEWRDNYDNTEQYPMVLPSKGFYNIVNGSYGIGVSASNSIPQYNLKEVNEALIKLLWNKDIDFDEIFCVPDFATGALLLNLEEVKESHRNGRGASCKLRSVVEFDDKDRCFIVKEIPYMVYTETICKQLEEIINDDSINPGIERFNDLTGEKPLIKIYLKKNKNPSKVLKFLYKNTSLQTHYSINFTILENGRFPKVYNWKQLLQAHLDHEKEIYTKSFQFDLQKIKARLHIIEGLMKAYDMIDEVIHTIKDSNSTVTASIALQKLLKIDEIQAKAILDLKLARLSKLDINKLKNEQENLNVEKKKIEKILSDESLLKKEIEKGLREVAENFGDNRRTKVLNIEKEEDDIIEEKNIQIYLTNYNNIYTKEISNLYTQKRGGVGNKFKLEKGEYVIATASGRTTDTALFFTNKGNSYHCQLKDLALEEKIPLCLILKIADDEIIYNLVSTNKSNSSKYIIFFTKNGLIKKSNLSNYLTNRTTGIKAISLDDDDIISSILIVNEEPVCMMSKNGHFVITETKNISSLGRTTKGRKGMKLEIGDYLQCAHLLENFDVDVLTISKNGYSKRTSLKDFNITSLGTKGVKIQKLKEENDYMVDFIFTSNEKTVTAISSEAQIKINLNDVPVLSKNTYGNKIMKLNKDSKIVGITKNN